mmetsp:Transcript_35755/g.58263  ORF Transcript_35755/g.58263 Transcript_35755/m.58263 type:complete len:118 (-) Transcript_35755:153-506(-)
MFSKDGIHHTITAWESKEALRYFFSGEEHFTAMKDLKDFSSYVKVHGYFTDELPSPVEAIDEWRNEGRRVYGEPTEKCGDMAPKACWPCTEFVQRRSSTITRRKLSATELSIGYMIW